MQTTINNELETRLLFERTYCEGKLALLPHLANRRTPTGYNTLTMTIAYKWFKRGILVGIKQERN